MDDGRAMNGPHLVNGSNAERSRFPCCGLVDPDFGRDSPYQYVDNGIGHHLIGDLFSVSKVERWEVYIPS